MSPDGQVEIDAIGEGPETWVVEVKWRSKRAGIKELRKLLQKAQQHSAVGVVHIESWFYIRCSSICL